MKFSLAMLALVPLVAAHFTLDYPATRGFDEDLEPRFCGGFPNPSSERAPFPLSGPGSILIDSHHPTAQVAIIAAVGYTNVTSFANFNKTASGQPTGMLMPFGTIQGQGEWCFNIDFSTLGATNITDGTPATIQVEFNGGDGLLLQCADVILVNNYVAPSNLTCRNATSASTSTTNAATTTTTTASGTTNTPAATTTGAKSAAGKHVVGGLVGSLSIVALALLV
ncbi:BQ5605_C007g04610 [Microbotryum silenes-dioicae]|uniref:BQ5605_C007g04610 protein n=1 Tax=Microbotryum silenes-dioicae TaxID=796604 RepID=A0A2X0M7J6_9BASI|nr:BQ5605_C007g04610 [Microbotryum silenes-dioicae]